MTFAKVADKAKTYQAKSETPLKNDICSRKKGEKCFRKFGKYEYKMTFVVETKGKNALGFLENTIKK